MGPGPDRASYRAGLGLELMRDPVGRLEWGDPTVWLWWNHWAGIRYGRQNGNYNGDVDVHEFVNAWMHT